MNQEINVTLLALTTDRVSREKTDINKPMKEEQLTTSVRPRKAGEWPKYRDK